MHPAGPWLQFTVSSTRPALVEAVLDTCNACAITLHNADTAQAVEPSLGDAPNWRNTIVTGLFPSATVAADIAAALQLSLGDDAAIDWRAELIEDRDWVRAWLDDYQPLHFGRRLWVCPKGQRVVAPDNVVVHLDPGLAFGTGSHPSTALCLEWLDANPPGGKTVIDYGCGSGILAIAAARLGARAVWAVDIDPQALVATRNNAADNGVLDTIHILPAADLPPLHADLLLANILAAPLRQLAPVFARHTRAGSTVVLAGLLIKQQPQIRAAYQPWFEFSPQTTRDEWLCMQAIRISQPVSRQ